MSYQAALNPESLVRVVHALLILRMPAPVSEVRTKKSIGARRLGVVDFTSWVHVDDTRKHTPVTTFGLQKHYFISIRVVSSPSGVTI